MDSERVSMTGTPCAVAYISRAALRHNARLLRATAGVPLCAVLKANAYGHDVTLTVAALAGLDIKSWGVATLDEALSLRSSDGHTPILVLCPYAPIGSPAIQREQADLMAQYGLRVTLSGARGLEVLTDWAQHRRARQTLHVHLKIDTGMRRSGCPAAQAVALACRVAATPGLVLEGVYSHFAGADLRDLTSARRQLRLFQRCLSSLAARGVRVPIRHLANSAAIFTVPGAGFEMARPGIGLYGYVAPGVPGAAALKPVLRLEAPVVLERHVPRGTACGYGGTFVARRPTRLGLLPIGYADGYDRRWSNRGVAGVGTRLIPVAGRVSMDYTLLDLTDAPEVRPGTPVTLISNKPCDPHAAQALARRLRTLPHEVFCALGSRVRRVAAE